MNLPIMVARQPFVEALVTFLVICQLSFALLVGDIFVGFLGVIYPKIKDLIPASSNTLRQWVIDMYEARKVKLKTDILASPSLVHFSFDLWSSPNHLALLGVVAHYINDRGRSTSVCMFSLNPLPNEFKP